MQSDLDVDNVGRLVGANVRSCAGRLIAAVFVSLLGLTAETVRAQAPSYSTHYNPLTVHNYSLTMNSTDWNTVKGDSTYTIEKPAYFNAADESKILISVRRKPTLPQGGKVSLKLDINQYFDGTVWHGVKKVSLENGQQSTVLREATAWYLQNRAADYMNATYGTNYRPGKFTFANVYVNGANQGLYTHVEQVDKQFLRNRDAWKAGETWLFKAQDVNNIEYNEGPTPTSPTMAALNFAPFVPGGAMPPDDATALATVPQYVNMDALLTMAAVNAYTCNRDNLATKGKNFFWSDYEDLTTDKRQYYPWDLDGVIPVPTATLTIYPAGTAGSWPDFLLGNPTWRMRFNNILLELINGPFASANVNAYLNQLEPILTPSVLADPNNNMGSPATAFNDLRNWISARNANVLSQVNLDMAALGATTGIPEPASATLVMFLAAAAVARRRRVP